MNLTPEEVQRQYTLIEELDHQELIPFVQQNLRHPTPWSRGYFVVNAVMFGISIYLLLGGANSPADDPDGATRVAYFFMGFAGTILLIPLHEWLHGLAYRWAGAPQVTYDANWKKFYFMAVADRFVTSHREFIGIALAPFLTITTALVVLAFMIPLPWSIALTGTLLLHSGMCSGDFGLLSWFYRNRNLVPVTYDDRVEGKSFFYASKNLE